MRNSILVLGDSGLLGQALMVCGNARGLRMRGASRRSADLALDALDSRALDQALDAASPEVVINATGLVDVNRCEREPSAAWLSNARIPALLAASCGVRSIRLVHLSTDHYYSGDGIAPHDETHPVAFHNEYARTKYAGECMALTCPQALVVRTNIVGFRNWDGSDTFVEWLLGALVRETPIELYSDFYTSSIAATQLADILFHLLQTHASGVLNVACREGASKLDFATALAATCGLSMRATRAGSVLAVPGARRAESLVLDTTRAERLLGAQLPDLDAVVQQLAREYRMRKPL